MSWQSGRETRRRLEPRTGSHLREGLGRGQEDVLGLQVTVDDVLEVEVSESHQDLSGRHADDTALHQIGRRRDGETSRLSHNRLLNLLSSSLHNVTHLMFLTKQDISS